MSSRPSSESPGAEVTPWGDPTDLSIRPSSGPGEYSELVRIWRSAVDATHDFLADEHRDEIESRLASDYFPHVELHVAELGGAPVGFAGISGENLEMLFVDARERGHGVGSALLSFVVERGVTTVDVNEQNAQAVEFYRRRGFTLIGRSELDDQGRPYPLLHLALRAATDIPSFRPSSEWSEDWPFDVDTRVRIEARVTGPAADRAVEAFLEPLAPRPGRRWRRGIPRPLLGWVHRRVRAFCGR